MSTQVPREEIRKVNAVGAAFYKVVPVEYDRCCVLNSLVAARALRRLGLECDLLPCQLWCARPGANHAVGFAAQEKVPGRWDGHVVCASRTWFLDAAVSHLRVDFDADVPRTVAGLRFTLPSQAIGRYDVGDAMRLWWYHPPAGVDPTPPREPPELVERFGDALFDFVRARLEAGTPA